MPLNRRRALAAVLGFAAAFLGPASGALRAQAAAGHGDGGPPDRGRAAAAAPNAAPRWFPGSTSFAPLRAAPREVGLRGALVVADRGGRVDDFRGANLEADVALGHRLAVARLRPETSSGPELSLGLEAGAFSRFFMESPQKDLIAIDYRVGVPLSARYRGWEARLAVRHVSSHFGDDFVNRFDPPRGQSTRDGLELLAARRLAGGVRLYAGGEWNFHANTGVEEAAARAGLEWDPAPGRGGGPPPGRADAGGDDDAAVWPYGAVDARTTSLEDDGAIAGSAGVGIRIRGVTLRVRAEAHAGSTPLGSLTPRDETYAGVGVVVEP